MDIFEEFCRERKEKIHSWRREKKIEGREIKNWA
jgi:hypothetical protein